MGKKPDELVRWCVWVRDALAQRGCAARLTYDDKVDGDVLLLAVSPSRRDDLVEITIARRKKGRAHLAVTATTAGGVTAVHEALANLHAEVPRLANAKRKFVHRIERLVGELARSWDARRVGALARSSAYHDALARLREVVPEAVPMRGVGFRAGLAGDGDHHHHTREVYPTLCGAAVPVDVSWRGLAWDAQHGRWLARSGTLTALLRSRSGQDLERAGISLGDVAIAGAVVVGAGAVAASLFGGNELDDEVEGRGRGNSSCGDVFDPCDLIDCAFDLSDLGNCIPDCGSFDCGGFDGLDCSL
ncbi:MAG: hypothetical protein KIT31_32235 [Deltaproteobacteria bacterium]|nr:hypothetical protein [Deltaproteobacteria bacterium]